MEKRMIPAETFAAVEAEERLMLGNEAVAQGAWEAGVRVAASYPGTPSTESTASGLPMRKLPLKWLLVLRWLADVPLPA